MHSQGKLHKVAPSGTLLRTTEDLLTTCILAGLSVLELSEGGGD